MELNDVKKELYKAKQEDKKRENRLFPGAVRPLEEITAEMLSLHDSQIDVLCDYLQKDSYEITKNIAKTINSTNQSEVISFLDGALSRNDALIKKLQEIRTQVKQTATRRQKGIVL